MSFHIKETEKIELVARPDRHLVLNTVFVPTAAYITFLAFSYEISSKWIYMQQKSKLVKWSLANDLFENMYVSVFCF